MGRDPGAYLVRLALPGDRDVDGELLFRSVLDGPLDGAEDLKLRGLAIRPGQPTSRPAEVKAGTNSAPRQVTVGSITADPSVTGWRRAAEARAALG